MKFDVNKKYQVKGSWLLIGLVAYIVFIIMTFAYNGWVVNLKDEVTQKQNTIELLQKDYSDLAKQFKELVNDDEQEL